MFQRVAHWNAILIFLQHLFTFTFRCYLWVLNAQAFDGNSDSWTSKNNSLNNVVDLGSCTKARAGLRCPVTIYERGHSVWQVQLLKRHETAAELLDEIQEELDMASFNAQRDINPRISSTGYEGFHFRILKLSELILHHRELHKGPTMFTVFCKLFLSL